MWGFVKGDIMTYTEKEISYADYVRLRESVNWNNFSKEQTEEPSYQGKGIGSNIVNKLIEYVYKETPVGGRSSIQLIAEKGKESFYEKLGFKFIPHEFCGSAMRKIIRK